MEHPTIFDHIKNIRFKMGLSESDLIASLAARHTGHFFDAGDGYAVAELVSPDTSRVWGFDCSHWSGPVNMQTAKANGASFVFIKMKDGTVSTKWFPENYAAAKGLLYRGPYVWLYPSDKVSVTLQAQAWWNGIKDNLSELPLVIDFEWTYWGGSPANPSINDLTAAVQIFNQLSGNRKPIVYTAPGYIMETGPIPSSLVSQTAGLWVAHYGVITPTIPKNYTSWLFHQSTDQLDGTVVGYDPAYSTAADLDYFNGTAEELAILVGDEPMADPIFRGVVEPGLPLCVFTGPNRNAVRVVNTLPSGGEVYGTIEQIDLMVWLVTQEGYYVPVRKVDSGGSTKKKWLTLYEVTTPPPADGDIPTFGEVDINGKTYQATDWTRLA